ncbi:discoidin domain-containing protein [Kutzneria buriramensis]|uniref:F5/8 type C domain-containing protein n=1 Tax=Kutzneria buriramensis TaxID=1045776 RepID=A0A3E0GYQ9_9PSEU|nr:discoidin domain-containing protein [Kutzneria buriramensis]REH32936.1 F5/8 type C domain-containing protein [Kutzneria buriramensis]
MRSPILLPTLVGGGPTTLLSPASAAVDGDTDIRWSSAAADPQWLQADLGATSSITQVVLQRETAYAMAFQIQVSDNGNDWNPIYTNASGAGGKQTLNVSGCQNPAILNTGLYQQAANTGLTVEMPGGYCYADYLIQAAQNGQGQSVHCGHSGVPRADPDVPVRHVRQGPHRQPQRHRHHAAARR